MISFESTYCIMVTIYGKRLTLVEEILLLCENRKNEKKNNLHPVVVVVVVAGLACGASKLP